MFSKDYSNLTAIVISFLRPGYTKACVRSLAKQYLNINILVGENGQHDPELAEVVERAGGSYIKLPFDSGVCYARNKLIEQVQTDYVLVGDDDFFYTAKAGVENMLEVLENEGSIDLVGGRVEVNEVVQNYQGHIEFCDRYIHVKKLDEQKAKWHLLTYGSSNKHPYCFVDLTFNYFVARTDKVRAVPWDEQIKVAYEHLSWFADFKKAGGKVVYMPTAIVIHKPEHVDPQQSADYPEYRNRKSDKQRFFEKFDIDYTITMNGTRDYKPDHVIEARKNDTKYVDFCITTFKRPEALKRLLFSIAKYYPMANVYVADQNKTFDRNSYKKLRADLQTAGLIKRVSFERLPYDCGVSYARNHLVRTTPNKYKLILDDDMEFTEDTQIGKMVTLLEDNPRTAIVGGAMTQLGNTVNFEFNLEIKNGTVLQLPDNQPYREHKGIKYKKTGCVLNFALMRKDLFTYITWDNELKVTEHTDFYLRMKPLPFQIFYTPDVIIDHPPVERSDNYKALRQRSEFMVKMMKRHKVKRIKYLNGQVTELLDDGSLKRYKEQPE